MADLPTLVQSYPGGVLGTQKYTASSIYDDALVIDAYLAKHTGGATPGPSGSATGCSTRGRTAAACSTSTHRPRSTTRATRDRRPRQQHRRRGVGRARPGSAVRGDRDHVVPGRGAWPSALDPGELRERPRARRLYRRLRRDRERITWKSTEHNIDVYAFFRLLGRQTDEPVWQDRASTRAGSSWRCGTGHRAGSTWARSRTASPRTTSPGRGRQQLVLPGAPRSRLRGVDRLGRPEPGRHAGRLSGVSISTGDRGGVWFEGTAHLADALETRGRPGDPPGRRLPVRHRVRAGARPERGRPGHHGRVRGRAHRLRG